MRLWAVLASVIACAFAEPVTLIGRAMGTTWSVKFLQPATPLDPSGLALRIAERLEALEQQFSTFRPNSELSRFNANADQEWFPVSPELALVAAESRRISQLTGGAFDATVDPLVRLWGFGPGGRGSQMPDAKQIAAAHARIGWEKIEARLDQPTLRRLRPSVTADFSSLAKGFAADSIGELLVSLGARHHFVQIGGDIKAGGDGAAGNGWRAGIETPSADPQPIACIVTLRGLALSTSGDYRNFVTADGRRYGHIIDPRTGAPVQSGLAAVSVVHEHCATSSALATALFVLGPEEGLALAKRERIACLFFVRDGRGLTRQATPEFQKLQQ